MSERIVAIGEALIDIVPTADGTEVRELPGGSPANVAVTLARLGQRPELVTTLAADARGDALRTWLGDSDVVVHAHAPASGRTSTAEVVLDPDGSARYLFDLIWGLPRDGLGAAGLGDADADAAAPAVVHAGSIATVLEPGASAVEAALRAAQGRALVTLDPNARPTITSDVERVREQVERLVALADVVKVSAEDAEWYYPDLDPERVARAWLALPDGPVVVVVTLGGDGSVLLRRAVDGVDEVRVPARRVEVTDTIGAGDTFTGALIDALVRLGASGSVARTVLARLTTDDLRGAVTWAGTAAAVTVSRPGANPPTRAEMLAAG